MSIPLILYLIKQERASNGKVSILSLLFAVCPLTVFVASSSSSSRKYLSAFKKIVSVPVELVSSAATTISSPFQTKTTPSLDISVDTSAANTPPAEPSTPEIGQEEEKDKNRLSSPPVSAVVDEPDKKLAESGRKRSSSQTGSRPISVSSVKADKELNNAMQELDALQHLLSLELCLQLIHINKDAEHRVQRFVKVGFPGRLRTDV